MKINFINSCGCGDMSDKFSQELSLLFSFTVCKWKRAGIFSVVFITVDNAVV